MLQLEECVPLTKTERNPAILKTEHQPCSQILRDAIFTFYKGSFQWESKPNK